MIKLLRYSASGALLRGICCLIALVAAALAAPAQVTVVNVTHNGIVYDFVRGSDNQVVVSAYNASMYKDHAADIVIPAKITNEGTTSTDHTTEYTVVGFADAAFAGSAITSIKVEAPVTAIPANCFTECYSLRTVELPGTVETIGETAFAFRYDDSVHPVLESITGLDKLTSIGDRAFFYANSIKSIELPETLVYIGKQAFQYCRGLAELTLPASLQKVDYQAFQTCEALEALTIKGPTVLGEAAFSGCKALTDVEFAEGVEISSNAMGYCTSLNVVTLKPGMVLREEAFFNSGMKALEWPSERIEVESDAFGFVSGITELTIPGWMEKVPDELFENSTGIEEIILGEGVREIGNFAFGCNRPTDVLKRVRFADGAANTLTTIDDSAFEGNSGLAEFPFAEGQTLRNKAFYDTGFTTVTLYKGMSIGNQALQANNTLTEIVWPDEPLASLGVSPFGVGNKVMTEITFPAWMTELPQGMCSAFKALVKANIPATVRTIGHETFYNCIKLQCPDFSALTALAEIGYRAFAIQTDSKDSDIAPAKVTELWTPTFPTSLKKIGDYAFAFRLRLNPTFNEGLEEIGNEAFYNAGTISNCRIFKITLPSTLKVLGLGAFSYCTQMQEVDLSKTQLTSISNYAFAECTNLNNAKWPTKLTAIGTAAFRNHKLKHGNYEDDKVIPSTVTEIGDYAFYNATPQTSYIYGFSSLDLSKVKSVGRHAFQGCQIKDITWPEKAEIEVGDFCFQKVYLTGQTATFPACMTVTPRGMYKGSSTVYEVDFKNVEVISDSTFAECNMLYGNKQGLTMTIPSTVKTVCRGAFYKTGYKSRPYALVLNEGTEVQIDAFSDSYISGITFKGCVEISGSAFARTSLTSLNLPDCLTDIPDRFFAGMTSLQTVSMPSGLKRIGNDAFKGCTALTSVELPETLEEIGEGAFSGCKGLTEINLPDRDIKIGNEAFAECSGLTSLTIPAALTVIPDKAFYFEWSNNRNMVSLTFEPRNGNPLSIGEKAFFNFISIPEIILPEGLYELGEGAFQYCFGVTEISIPSTLTSIPASAFGGCQQVTSLDLSHVTALGQGAFGDCKSLTELKLYKDLTEIPNQCFGTCYSLENLDLPVSVHKIGDGAFADCRSLKELNLHEGIDTIGFQAFAGHMKLRTLELPRSLRYLGDNAFSGYTNSSLSVSEFTDPETLRQWVAKVDETDDCSQLEEVINHAENARIGNGMFEYNFKLKKYTADYPTETLGHNMFRHCLKLEEVVFPDTTAFLVLSDEVFLNCASLKEFPYEVVGGIRWRTFYNCISMKQLLLPTSRDYRVMLDDEDYINNYNEFCYDWYKDDVSTSFRDFFYYNYGHGHVAEWAYNMVNMQSFVANYDGRCFGLNESMIKNAPLRGVSYCYADNIRPLNFNWPNSLRQYKPNPTILTYGRHEGTEYDYNTGQWVNTYYTEVADNTESVLMVRPGQKWKYMEAGYGERFNIIEMKDTEPTIDGDIYSTYDEEENVNHYQAILRWEVELSDLDATGSTYAEVYCDGAKIADVEFTKPLKSTGTAFGVTCDNDNDEVLVTYVKFDDALTREFIGNYSYPIEYSTGEGTNHTFADSRVWLLDYNFLQAECMVFDAETHRRLNAFETYEYRSLFTLVHKFDSPKLEVGADIPKQYTYQVKVKGYEYEEPVNNEGFLPDANGRYWHYGKFRLPDVMASNELVMYPATGAPTFSCDGMYTTAEVMADRDRSLPAVAPDPAQRNYSVGVVIDPDVASQQVFVDAWSTMENVVQDVTTYEVPSAEVSAQGYAKVMSRYAPARTRRSIAAALASEADADTDAEPVAAFTPQVGGSYLAVISTLNRGTFGTQPITIPDMPTLTSNLVLATHEHMPTAIHDRGTFYGHMYLTPDVTPLGYDSSMPADGEYFLGVWRKLDLYDRDSDWAQGIVGQADGDEEAPELIYHTEGRVADINEPVCTDCASGAAFSIQDSQMVHSDVFDAAAPLLFNVAYDARLYAKVPAEYTAGEDRWVALDTRQEGRGDVLTGIENVTVDGPGAYGEGSESDGDIRWYDLQGRRVAKPVPGEVYIKVTGEGNSKVRFM